MNECLQNKYIFWIDLNASPGRINCSLFYILLVVYDFHNYRISHITFYSFILGVYLMFCHPLETMISLSLMLPNPSELSPNICGTELCRNYREQWTAKCLTNVTDNYYQMTWIIFLYTKKFLKFAAPGKQNYAW